MKRIADSSGAKGSLYSSRQTVDQYESAISNGIPVSGLVVPTATAEGGSPAVDHNTPGMVNIVEVEVDDEGQTTVHTTPINLSDVTKEDLLAATNSGKSILKAGSTEQQRMATGQAYKKLAQLSELRKQNQPMEKKAEIPEIQSPTPVQEFNEISPGVFVAGPADAARLANAAIKEALETGEQPKGMNPQFVPCSTSYSPVGGHERRMTPKEAIQAAQNRNKECQIPDALADQPRQLVGPPKNQVMIEIEGIGVIETAYHEVVRCNDRLLLAYDRRFVGGTRYHFPESTTDRKIMLDVIDMPDFFVVQSLGLTIPFLNYDLCLLLIEEAYSKQQE